MINRHICLSGGLCVAILLATGPHLATGDEPRVDKLTATAARLAFVPGDAFFAVRMESPDDLVYKLVDFGGRPPADEEQSVGLELEYQLPGRTTRLVEYQFGFSRIDVLNVTEADRGILMRLVELTEQEQKRIDFDEGKSRPLNQYVVLDDIMVPVETLSNQQSFCIVIVNKNIDFARAHPYVRYNEDWNLEQPQFWPGSRELLDVKPLPFHADSMFDRLWPRRYQPHVPTAEAVLEDWMNGPQIAPLNVRIPETISRGGESATREIMEPVEVNYGDIAFVGYPTGDVEQIYGKRLNSTFYVATTEGLHRYRWILGTGKTVGPELHKELIEEPERE